MPCTSTRGPIGLSFVEVKNPAEAEVRIGFLDGDGSWSFVGTDVLVGGQTAMNVDVRDASDRDLRVIIPAILLVVFLVLGLIAGEALF